MIQRTTNPNNKHFANYGGRGITIAPAWMKFENFLADMGERPSANHSIERSDNDLGYSKENCRWATRKEQGRNQRSNRIIEFNGKSMCASAWSEFLGFKPTVVASRLRLGWSVEKALTSPLYTRS